MRRPPRFSHGRQPDDLLRLLQQRKRGLVATALEPGPFRTRLRCCCVGSGSAKSAAAGQTAVAEPCDHKVAAVTRWPGCRRNFGLSDPTITRRLVSVNQLDIGQSLQPPNGRCRPAALDAFGPHRNSAATLGQRALHRTRLPVDRRSGLPHGRDSFQLEALESNTAHLVLATLPLTVIGNSSTRRRWRGTFVQPIAGFGTYVTPPTIFGPRAERPRLLKGYDPSLTRAPEA